MSLNRLTFSLTSLIFLIALGLVFVPTSVMAHVVVGADGHTAATPAHPVVKSVTLLGAAADGYVGDDSFVIEVVFEAGNTAKLISASTVGDALLADVPAKAFDTIETNQINATTYRIRLKAAAAATTGTESSLYVGGETQAYTPAAPATGDDPARPTVTYDTIAPTVGDGTPQPMAGKSFPLNNKLTEAFDVVFQITDSATAGARDGMVDGTTFKLTASPDTVTFSNLRSLGSNKFAATVTPKPVTKNETLVTITASVMDMAGNTGMGTAEATLAARMAEEEEEEETPTPTELAAMKTGLSVKAGKFILLVRNKMNVRGLPDTLPDGAMIVEWDSMPDLEALLYSGGSIDLTRAKAPKLDHDAKADTDARDAGARDLIITEVMWAKNTALTGKSRELDHQWIEIYNPLKADVGGVTITTTKKRDFQTIADTDVLLDRLSNQVGAGWALSELGQNGSNDYDDMTDDVKSNFISMFRNNRGKEGWTKGHWSPSTETAIAGHKGTPGRLERTAAVVIATTSVPREPFVINEFGIGNSDGEDWVELRNVTDSVQNLKNLLLTSVTGLDKEEIEFHFHDKGIEIPAKGVVLIASTSPVDTDIAAGRNLEVAADDQEKTGVDSIYVVRNFELPTGKFNLILRKDYNNKFDADFKGKALEKVIDAVGSLKVDKDTADFNTDFWPLNGTGAPHGDVIEGLGQDFKGGTVYIRKDAGGGTGEHDLGKVGYSGIGYDRIAAKSDANGGTPGFANDALKDKIAGLMTGEVTISEIMVDVGGGRQHLPQWIELYNSSKTQAVNLNGWKLHIENAANGDGTLEVNTFSAMLTLGSVIISPNQTVLIASSTGRVSDPDHFPRTRVVNLWTTKAYREALEMTRRTDPILNTTGFNITLSDKDGMAVDSAGNLDGNRRTRDEPTWMLPMSEEDGRRSSLIRVYDEGVAVDGTMAAAWVSADMTNQVFSNSQTFYGDEDDFGTPGFRGGGPLPVNLSKFRPERLESGEVVIRWATESELNNAGFNILRSDTRDGEFTKINTSLIAGHGTTSERNTYEWKDTSAKPNVVYYYQIQDVSLDGKVQTLRQSRLKGDVSPAGKLTTIWGEIKALH